MFSPSHPLNSYSEWKHAIRPTIYHTAHALCLLKYPKQFPLLWVSDWEWQRVKDTASFLCLFQIHSREMLTKSISLPRSAYWQHITRQNSVGDLYSYQGTGMRLLIIIRKVLLFLYLLVSVDKVERQTGWETGEKILYPATKALYITVSTFLNIYCLWL